MIAQFWTAASFVEAADAAGATVVREPAPISDIVAVDHRHREIGRFRLNGYPIGELADNPGEYEKAWRY
jgi:hypothetical protein